MPPTRKLPRIDTDKSAQKRTPLWLSLISIAVVSILLGVGAWWGWNAYMQHQGYYENSKGEMVAPYTPSDPNASRFTGEDGNEYIDGSSDGLMDQPIVVDNSDPQVAHEADAVEGGADTGSSHPFYAPMPENPAESYEGSYASIPYTSDATIKTAVESLEPGQWYIPDLHKYDGSQVSAYTQWGSFTQMPDNTPGYSGGIVSSFSERLSSQVGSSVLAGHVNQVGTGYLSDWGYLHQAKTGMHVYLKDENGAIREYVIDRIRVIDQGEPFRTDPDVWSHEGDHRINLVTCAGAYVGDDGTEGVGGTLWFPYTKNLDVQASEVK